ncbi:hypothetical protein ADUPG1_001729, partial [Aduncisulcus paluster]
MIDTFTRVSELAPLRKKNAKSVAKEFLDHICLRYTVPSSILTDWGTEFDNALMKSVSEFLGFQHLFAITHNPRSMGIVERLNGVIKRSLLKMKSAIPKKEYAVPFCFDKHISDLTPSFLKSYVDDITERILEIQESARENQEEVKKNVKKRFDIGKPFEKNEYVWLVNPAMKYSLQTPLLGPYRISQCITRYKYKIKDLISKDEFTVSSGMIRHVVGTHSEKKMKLI